MVKKVGSKLIPKPQVCKNCQSNEFSFLSAHCKEIDGKKVDGYLWKCKGCGIVEFVFKKVKSST